jgi:hypothetical protein
MTGNPAMILETEMIADVTTEVFSGIVGLF